MNDLQLHEQQTIDFVVDGNFVEKLPAILSNIAELKSWAERQTAFDRNAVITEDTVQDAKDRSTALNKVIQSIDKKRKEVKKAYNAPYAVFEKSLNEVVAVLTTARENLWSQALAFEQKIKDEKRATFKDYWETINDGLTCRDYEMVEDNAWLNKGKSYKSVYKEMDELKEKQQSDIAAIYALESDFLVELINDYIRNGKTLSEIIAKNAQLKAAREKIAPVADKNAPKIEVEQKVEEAKASESKQKYTVKFRVEATESQLIALKKFFVENGIEFFPIQ